MKRKQSGFSLLEVAIALTIIGLVTGFVIKGRELIRTAKLRSVIEQVNVMRVAIQSFTDRYNALPGDLTNATDIWGGNVTNGRGDGIINSPEDVRRFWAQLSAADLISMDLVGGYPKSKIGGYFTISTNVSGHSGTWLILSGSTNDNANFNGILSPEDAHFIDKNCDTGNPHTGEVHVIKASNATGECFAGQTYNFQNKNNDCVILFRIW